MNSEVEHESKRPEGLYILISALILSGGEVAIYKQISKYDNSTADQILEQLDRALTVDLFLSVGGISMAIVALLLPKLLDEAEAIRNLKKDNDSPGTQRVLDFRSTVRAQKHFMSCFLLCLVGVAGTFTFDGVLEFQPDNLDKFGSYYEIEGKGLINSFAGQKWMDLTEGATMSSVLFAALGFLGVGARTFFAAIKKVYESTDNDV